VLRAPGAAGVARGPAPPARLARVPRVARAARRPRRPASHLCHRGAAAVRGGGGGAVRQGVGRHGAARAPRAAPARRAGRPRRPSPSRPREGPSRRLPLRQHRHVRGSPQLGRRGGGGARGGGLDSGVKRIGLVALLAAAAVAGVAAWTLASQPEWYQRVRYPLRYEAIVRTHARNYDLPPALVAAVIYAESKFDASARSDAAAVGLMQLLPDTAQGIAVRTGGNGFVQSDLLDPEINVRYGSWYLRHLLARYDDDVPTALAAYHAGQGNVDAWRRRGVGIQFPETRPYVKRVLDAETAHREACPAVVEGLRRGVRRRAVRRMTGGRAGEWRQPRPSRSPDPIASLTSRRT